MGFVVDKEALGVLFLRIFNIACQYYSTSAPACLFV
jgi:hypothetical protein